MKIAPISSTHSKRNIHKENIWSWAEAYPEIAIFVDVLLG